MRYTPKRKPYAHQVAALRHLVSTGRGGALLMDPRTGKTQTTLDYASVLHMAGNPRNPFNGDPAKTNGVILSKVLIVCPVSVMGVWEDEIAAVVPDSIHTNVVIWDRVARSSNLRLPSEIGALNFVIVNYDAFSAPGQITGSDEFGNVVRSNKRGGRYDAANAVRSWAPEMIVLDESHRIKTPSARKTRIIQGLGRIPSVKWRVIMTGTSVTKKNRVFDIYSQWKFLNPEGWIKDFTAADFKDKFGVWRRTKNHKTGGSFNQMLRLKNVALLHQLIHTDAFAVTREECFDLPPQRLQISHVTMDETEKRTYDEMAEDMVARITSGEITEAQIKLTQVLRLAQITSGIAKTSPSPEHPEGRLVRIGSSKLKHLEDRLEDLCLQNEEKVVIVARFRADLLGIAQLCNRLKIPVHEMHGGIKQADRTQAIRQFKDLPSEPRGRVFLMQPQVGSLGIDLRSASTMIWYSLTNSYVDWDQCNQRTALNPKGTVVEFMLAQGTVDEIMLASLIEDQDVARMIHKSPQYLLRGFKAKSEITKVLDKVS